MIQNLTPEEKDSWDKSMSSYQQKLENRSRRGFKLLAVLFAAGLLLMTVFALFYQLDQKAKTPVQIIVDSAVTKGWPTDRIIYKVNPKLFADSFSVRPTAEGHRKIIQYILEGKRRDSL